ncbi:Muscle M-line assembly protein unc-89 [Wickerhamomyces ciferrii]|uniref:Muscle M-line assembly protein unc-89 n=1 Tax=Wickerhamomyces ciferrii (strain ATCC 14091 / BCRC 22168 / CBS 111 / JCM 3599 / NBRC 0793 / NRRL Y-1031 F-60-10) TaxID=1206466 RepID=K0KM20_WICCF|nr:Muscle M-line assembly protein unc-89 [Wickerhamomyces ciferrii]CCH46270.1 Muscle M-line assembly protein unc-89 [Wickerhamomyces ciferrii]
MPKQNSLWRLDLLEVEFLKTEPRYPKSKVLLKSKRKQSLIPSNKSQALKEIDALRQDVFDKKLHSSLVKYKRALKKIVKAPASKKTSEEETKFIKSLDIDRITNIKIVKLIQNVFKLIPKKLQNEPESTPKYLPAWIVESLTDKESPNNQSNFYNSLSQDQKNYYSKLMNHKEISSIVKIVENSFKIILGPVKDKDGKKDIEDLESSESESEEEETKGNDDKDEESEEEEAEDRRNSEDASDDDYSKYDALVAGSEDEDEEVELDNEINYNSVTDTEPSDQEQAEESESEADDFFEEEPKKTKKEKEKEKLKKEEAKYNLPELAAGYFSGGSDSEIEEDELVEEITKPKKKNRRGQRARQKIWEAKFKNNANHIKKERDEKQQQREQRQKEYEERVAKRAAKAKEMEVTGSNSAPLKQRTFNKDAKQPEPLPFSPQPEPAKAEEKDTKLHPSWEAKKRQEEALKNVKFQGKKVKF